jgi:hypothetical protein
MFPICNIGMILTKLEVPFPDFLLSDAYGLCTNLWLYLLKKPQNCIRKEEKKSANRDSWKMSGDKFPVQKKKIKGPRGYVRCNTLNPCNDVR